METKERFEVEERLALLRSVASALDRRSRLFAIVDESVDDDDACERILEEFDFPSRTHAQAVLELRVSRWTGGARDELSSEMKRLARLLAGSA